MLGLASGSLPQPYFVEILRLPDSEAKKRNLMAGVHLHRAVDGELGGCAKRELALCNVGIADGREAREEGGGGEEHGDDVECYREERWEELRGN